MSLTGLIPFVSIYSTFLQRGYDEVLHDIARMKSHVIIGIDRSGIVGEDGETHQGIYDLSFLMPIPNMVIGTPKDSTEAGNMLYTAILSKKPFSIRYSKNKISYQQQSYKILPIGSWEEIKKGKDGVIISYGDFLNNAISISNKLSGKLDIGVYNARYQKPIDTKKYFEILSTYKNIYIYEESTMINSLGAYLTLLAKENNYNNNIKVYAIPDEFVIQGNKKDVIKYLKLDETSIMNKVLKDIKKSD